MTSYDCTFGIKKDCNLVDEIVYFLEEHAENWGEGNMQIILDGKESDILSIYRLYFANGLYCTKAILFEKLLKKHYENDYCLISEE